MTSISERVGTVKHWRHQIRLPDGTITPGSQDTLAQREKICLPEDLTGKTVLDIGCSDGFYSFECEKRGAARVVAVDDFSSVYIDSPSGFAVAKEVLQSNVDFVNADLFQLDPKDIGTFDIVLFLGVLYHLRYPLLALDRLAQLCKHQMIIETEIIPDRVGVRAAISDVLGCRSPSTIMEFLEYDSINHDPTSWWRQSPGCVEAMMRSSGLCDVKCVSLYGNRGVFHGFSPEVGTDVDELIVRIESKQTSAAAQFVLGDEVFLSNTDDLTSVLRSLSITEFGAIKQRAFELEAKEWHQVRRWE